MKTAANKQTKNRAASTTTAAVQSHCFFANLFLAVHCQRWLVHHSRSMARLRVSQMLDKPRQHKVDAHARVPSLRLQQISAVCSRAHDIALHKKLKLKSGCETTRTVFGTRPGRMRRITGGFPSCIPGCGRKRTWYSKPTTPARSMCFRTSGAFLRIGSFPEAIRGLESEPRSP
jgi:hypothetical protein